MSVALILGCDGVFGGCMLVERIVGLWTIEYEAVGGDMSNMKAKC